ncbi:hypothetical protein [Neisseria mucosa]|nr:hypothetical protein [Neisseria mucosa]
MGVGRGAFQTTSLGKAYAAFSIVIPVPACARTGRGGNDGG